MASSSISISSLREQIIANAIHAYPSDVQEHLCRHEMGIIKPSEIFNVVITPDRPRNQTPTPRFCAVIVQHDDRPWMRMGSGILKSVGNSIEEALMGLLMALGEIAMHNLESECPTPQAIQDDMNAAGTLKFESFNQVIDFKEIEGRVTE